MHLHVLRHGRTDSVDGTFSAATEEPLKLILSTHGACLTETVKDTDGGRVYPKVFLIPDTRQPEYRSRVAVPDQYGAFSIDGTAPGAYHLYAFEKIQDDSWEDPGLLREIDGKGVALRFQEGAEEGGSPIDSTFRARRPACQARDGVKQ